MRLLSLFPSALIIAASVCRAEGSPDVTSSEYIRLLRATRFVENFQESAAVTARVLNAREQGNDNKYARFMSIVAKADLSDTTDCMVGVYRAQGLTHDDVIKISSFFESPLGIKLLTRSQQMAITDIERGSHQPPPQNVFNEEERKMLAEKLQNPSIRKYGSITGNKEFSASMFKCITESSTVKMPENSDELRPQKSKN